MRATELEGKSGLRHRAGQNDSTFYAILHVMKYDMNTAKLSRPATRAPRRRVSVRGIAFGLMLAAGLVAVGLPRVASSQPAARSGAWGMPDPTDLVSRAIRRIVAQDKPGGVPIAEFPHRAFGREETSEAVRAYLGRGVVLAPEAFNAVQAWSTGRANDSLPCSTIGAPPAAAPAVPDSCANRNALWLAITKIERGDLPHELHVWYATRFRADVQGSVQQSTYSFCERWLRVGGTWKYDGFVRVSKGVVAP